VGCLMNLVSFNCGMWRDKMKSYGNVMEKIWQ
jgi:hypothetical protein